MNSLPRRLVMLKPCCIGDVIFATALLSALRRAYPAAEIDWIVSSTAISALRHHPDLHAVIDSGPRANPASRPGSMWALIQTLRKGRYDLAVVPDRSRFYSLATLLAGIPQRAGLDSGGRGFGYTVKAPINPAEIRAEADIYLDVGRALGIDVTGCYAHVPPAEPTLRRADAIQQENQLTPGCFVMVHPGGGVNAGMRMVEKRWPADRFAALAARCAESLGPGAAVVLIGLESDRESLDDVKRALPPSTRVVDLSTRLSLAETAALAVRAALYLGNDNGVAHLAAAAGAKLLMIFGPSDPHRYAPFVPPERARYAWRPVNLPAAGVNAGVPLDFTWERDGVSVDEAWEPARVLLANEVKM